jgi:hypothetical protein
MEGVWPAPPEIRCPQPVTARRGVPAGLCSAPGTSCWPITRQHRPSPSSHHQTHHPSQGGEGVPQVGSRMALPTGQLLRDPAAVSYGVADMRPGKHRARSLTQRSGTRPGRRGQQRGNPTTPAQSHTAGRGVAAGIRAAQRVSTRALSCPVCSAGRLGICTAKPDRLRVSSGYA